MNLTSNPLQIWFLILKKTAPLLTCSSAVCWDWGLPLSMPYRSEEIDGCTVHTYNDGDLIACFDKNIPESVVKEIAKRKPLRAVFRDASFADSPAKINVFEIFKLYMPEDADDITQRVKVL